MEASSSGDGVAVDNSSNNEGASVTNACSLNVEIFEDAFSDEDVNTCGMEVGSSGDSVAVDHACGTENTRPTSYRQWLAWQITIRHSIDLADGVEPVEIMEPGVGFEGKVIIEPKEKAIEKAKKDCASLVI